MISDFSLPSASSQDEAFVPELPRKTLSELFVAAAEVLKLRPWKKLHDTDWFGIVDPESGATHVVAIMGAGGQFYAVQVYLPEEGIRFWNDFIKNGEPDANLGQYHQRMVSCEFVSWNEEDLDETDMDRNEKFDPDVEVDYLDSFLFRSVLPGCVNWHPTEVESRHILDALRLVPRFLTDWKKHSKDWYHIEFGDAFPSIPCYRLSDGKERNDPDSWKLENVPFPRADDSDRYLPDDLFPERLTSFSVRKGTTWQIGCYYFDKAVFVDGRPTWLFLSLIVTEPDAFAHGAELLPCTEGFESGLRKSLVKAAKEVGYLPEILKVSSELAQRVFSDVPAIAIVREGDLSLLRRVAGDFMASQSGDFENLFEELSEEGMTEIQAMMESIPPIDEITPDDMAKLMARLSKIDGGEAVLAQILGQSGLLDEGPFEAGSSGQKVLDFDLLGETAGSPVKKSLREDTGERFVFRIDLEGATPPIWRRVSIGTGATFADLHHVIQSLFDWEDCHLHSFMKRQGRRVTESIGPDPDNDDRSEDEVLLKDVFKRKGSKIHYLYDFGDHWSHLIVQEEKVKAPPGKTGPVCLAGRRIAPPEDCGGVWGFLNLLDPDSSYGEDMGWETNEIEHFREGKFDPTSVDFS